MNCPQCGSPIEPSATFCTNCGAHLSNIPPETPAPTIPKEYKPISPLGYIGWNILFSIPVIGFILLLVFSFSKGNLNRRNYARSFWWLLLIIVVLFIITAIAALILGSTDELLEMFEQLFAVVQDFFGNMF